ncbi:MAG: hypothetical protein K2Y56_17390 [Methylobacterium sp.]|uniref:hypothetical protein n=1 Tax=Methylobacterium sp. TaxID=409 RepID=UPI0025FCA436|nr:hypothetical protein [Methylobacterium sp.]MBX9933281.1 hypothetical protein [Methylobacterium sp.]
MTETNPTPPGLIARLKARYAEQAANPDVQKGRRYAAIVVAVGVILIGGYRIAQRHSRADDTSFANGVMPTCASPVVKRLLKDTIEESLSVKQASAVLQRTVSVQETGYVPVGAKGFEVRLCEADILFNLGRHDVPFTLTWISSAKDELWIEVQLPF